MTKGPSPLALGCFTIQLAIFVAFCAVVIISFVYMLVWQVDPLAPPEPPRAVCLDGTEQQADPHQGRMIDTVCQDHGGFDRWIESTLP